jgi:hypothetical protein
MVEGLNGDQFLIRYEKYIFQRNANDLIANFFDKEYVFKLSCWCLSVRLSLGGCYKKSINIRKRSQSILIEDCRSVRAKHVLLIAYYTHIALASHP